MTIVHLKSRHLKRSKYKCDACGKIDFWGKGWKGYGSVGHYDTCPEDVLASCSDECRAVILVKIKTREFILPELGRIYEAGADVVSERVGY